MAKVSIIIPIYNVETYMRECIDSALAQTFEDLELILVDDGSTDASGEIADEYAKKDHRVQVIHQENQGPAASRNAGLDQAKAPYIYYIDSDDVVEPDLLETVIPRMDEGYDMVAFSFETMPPTNQPDISQKYSEENKILLKTEEERYRFMVGPFRMRAVRWEVWNRVLRKDIIDRGHIRFMDHGRVNEDMSFMYCYMAHTSRILTLPKVLYHYRVREGSISKDYHKTLMITSSNQMAEMLYEYFQSCEDCRYISDHYLPLYYLLHKGAIRRLKKYQEERGKTIKEAREILKESIPGYPIFKERMIQMFNDPIVKESYEKDRGGIRQTEERIYTAELFEIPE